MKKKHIDHLNWEADYAAARIKAEISPKTPCVHSDEDGRCSIGNSQGSICCKCAEYKPVTKAKRSMAVVPAKPIEPEVVEPTALTITIGSIEFPAGVESLGEKANFLHAYSVEAGKRSTAAAILAGWCLSVARESCAHGMWLGWLEKNVTFNIRTAQNYMSLYAQTVGASRAALRRPIPLAEEPTMAELEAAAHDVDGKSLSAIYKSTRLIATSDNWGGAGRGQGRKPKDADVAAELQAVTEHEAVLWAASKGHLDELRKLDAEKDFLHRLSSKHLAVVAGLLADLSTKAAELLAGRMGE